MFSSNSRRDELYSLLGDLPERKSPLSVQKISEEAKNGFLVETLALNLNGLEPVPAVFIKPISAREPIPAVLYNHAHGGDYARGKRELLDGNQFLHSPYAGVLTAAGYAVLCIDHWGFGERRGRTESEIFKQMLWQGQVVWGMMVYDSLRALDYLATRADVDASRIATLGLSMGSTMAWWLGGIG